MSKPFQDRAEAGRVLADQLLAHRGADDTLVLALPRGGVPVGREVAERLGLPLDVLIVRKLGVPGREELAMGAIARGGTTILNRSVIDAYGIPDDTIARVVDVERRELLRREEAYREGRPPLEVEGAIVIIVDDGLATGSTVRAAALAVRELRPDRIVIAAPVGAPSTCRELAEVADEVVCAESPESFGAVGEWYRDFSQTTDDEVRALLRSYSTPAR